MTEIGTYERCQRKSWLSSKNGHHLTPLGTPLAFAVGTMWHRAHQLWITNPAVGLHMHALSAASESLDKTRKAYLSRTGVPASEEQLDTVYDATEFVVAMCDNYAIKYGEPVPAGYRFLSAEQKIVVAVPGTEHALEGKLDGLLQHIATGRIDVLERKSYKTRPQENSLKYNQQFLAYVWLVSQLNISPVIPHVLYDGAWRRQAIPKGRVFDDLFLRLELRRTQAELDEFARYLPHKLNEMAATYQDPTNLAEPMRRWQGCYDCPFDDAKNSIGLCSAISRGEDWALMARQKFTERTDDLEDETEEVTE